MAAAGDFVFISCADCSSSSSVILSWKVNSQTGAITQTSSASQPIAMWPGTDPSGKFLYAMSSSVYGFSINQQTGDLSSLPGSPYSVESANSTAPWISPDGTWLCTAGFTGPGASPPPDVSCAQRDPSTGAIFTSLGNQVTSGLGPYQGGSPFVKGNYLLANTLQSNSSDQSYSRTGIAVLQIAPSGINAVNTYPGIHGVIAVDPTGTLVGVSGDDSTLTLLSFNSTSATLTQDAQVTLPQTPDALTFTCDGKYLAVSNGSANTVSVYSVSNNGLQQVGSPVPVTSGASSQAVAPCPNEVTPQ
ncbi:MAG TPA: hypothetical protein VGS27_05525 [Candidatus Sulfotelmatobacter sp.]|nr:hypothetical protein [Candidatus Sulfotelmatobacter sp.]